MHVHRNAAAKPLPKKLRRKAAPVRTLKVSAGTRKAALALADGDESRLKTNSDGTVTVVN
jgi:hypothetical protein